MKNREWTLTEIAKLLQHPQHRLIYLCEKGIINPDGENTNGRGSSRHFSARNFFDFAVTLGFMAVSFSIFLNRQKYLSIFDHFKKVIDKSISKSEFPYSLIWTNAPINRAFLIEGSNL